MRPRRLVLLLFAASLLVATAGVAAAKTPIKHPPTVLWKSYPLGQAKQPPAQDISSTRRRASAAPVPGQGGGGQPSETLLVALIALLGGSTALFLLHSRRSQLGFEGSGRRRRSSPAPEEQIPHQDRPASETMLAAQAGAALAHSDEADEDHLKAELRQAEERKADERKARTKALKAYSLKDQRSEGHADEAQLGPFEPVPPVEQSNDDEAGLLKALNPRPFAEEQPEPEEDDGDGAKQAESPRLPVRLRPLRSLENDEDLPASIVGSISHPGADEESQEEQQRPLPREPLLEVAPEDQFGAAEEEVETWLEETESWLERDRPEVAPQTDRERCRIMLWRGYLNCQLYAAPTVWRTHDHVFATSGYFRLRDPQQPNASAEKAMEELLERLAEAGWTVRAYGRRWYDLMLERERQ